MIRSPKRLIDICRKLEEIASNQITYIANILIIYFLQKHRKIILSQ